MGVLDHVTSGRKPFFTRLTAERLLASVYPTMIHHHKFTMKPAAADITLVSHIVFVHKSSVIRHENARHFLSTISTGTDAVVCCYEIHI